MKILLIILLVMVLLVLLFLLCIKPNKKRNDSYFKGKMFAHRGLHDEQIPENSLLAFREAVKHGYGIELDVQMTKDGRLVVFHDDSLERMTGVCGLLRNYTYEQLSTFRLKNTEEKIPLFSEALKTLGTSDLICEIKNNNGNLNYEICQKTYDLLREYKGRYCIESFSPYLVRWFKRNHPEVIRGQLSFNMRNEKNLIPPLRFIMTNLMINIISKPDFVAYCHKDTNMPGFFLCKKLYRPLLFGWTPKGKSEWESAFKEFDSIIFEKKEESDVID